MRMKQIEKSVFGSRKASKERLLSFGFAKQGEVYCKETTLLDFTLRLAITLPNEVEATLLEDGYEYDAYRYSSCRGYALEVKDALLSYLLQVREACFEGEEQARRIRKAIEEEYGDSPIKKWEGYDHVVYEHSSNGKWYCLFMSVARKHLMGESGDDLVDVVNIKAKKEDIPEFIQNDGYFPAYHMSKVHWLTIALDGTLPDEEILLRIRESHALTKGK